MRAPMGIPGHRRNCRRRWRRPMRDRTKTPPMRADLRTLSPTAAQAPRRGPVLLMASKDKDGAAFDGGRHIGYRAGRRAGGAVLVGDAVRPGHTPYSRRLAARPLLAVPGLAEERRRVGGSLLRTEGAGGRTRTGCRRAPGLSLRSCSGFTGLTRPSSKKWPLPDIETLK